MISIKQIENLEKAFYSDGYKLGMKATEMKMAKPVLFLSIEGMYAAIDSLIQSLNEFAKKQKKRIDCKKGCEWCCHQPVFALDYELEFLSVFIKMSLGKNKLNQVLKKAKEKNNKLKELKKEELLNAKHPCPLLNNGSCIAYHARPMACRIYLSYDVSTCLKFHKYPDNKDNYPTLFDLPMRMGRMMNEGFKAALKTDGIIAKEFRIEEIL